MARHFKNNYSDVLVTPQSSIIHDQGVELDIRLPWYRSLPLSVVMPVELQVDGASWSLDRATLELEGRHHALTELPGLTRVWWFVQDSARLHVPAPGPVCPGPHEVTLTFNLYPPYIPMLTWVTRGTFQLGC